MPDPFETTCIKTMALKNRIVRSATHEGMSDENSFPQKTLFRLYQRIVRGGAGLIITGYAFVSRDGNSNLFRDNFSTIRGDAPLDAIVDDWDIYQRKNAIYRWIMKRFGQKIISPLPFSPAYNLEAAKTIKAAVTIPVFVVDGMVDPGIIKQIIARGDADYISLSRAIIADADFPEKIRTGSSEPSRCIHCNLCPAYATRRPLRCYHGKREIRPAEGRKPAVLAFKGLLVIAEGQRFLKITDEPQTHLRTKFLKKWTTTLNRAIGAPE